MADVEIDLAATSAKLFKAIEELKYAEEQAREAQARQIHARSRVSDLQKEFDEAVTQIRKTHAPRSTKWGDKCLDENQVTLS